MKVNKIVKVFLLAGGLVGMSISCTDLDVKVYDRVVDFWRT